MHSLTLTLLTFSSLFGLEPRPITEDPDQVESSSMDSHATSPVVLQQSPRQRPAPKKGPRTQKQRPRPEPKNPALSLFWNIFPPPGAYTTEAGVSVGANYLELAYGGRNPNIIYRGHFGIRPLPRKLPIIVYGMFDYSNYEQTAGPLQYNSRFFTLGAGAGLNYWVGPLRFDLMGETGLLTRISTQTDGVIDPITSTNVQPVLGLVAGGALAIKGKVAFSLRAAGRMYDFGPSRMDLSILYGIELMFGGRPVRYY